MTIRFSPGPCCNCIAPCNCCTGAMTSLSIAPTIYRPFTGPHASKNAGSLWYSPNDGGALFWNQPSNTFATLDCGTVKTAPSVAHYSQFFLSRDSRILAVNDGITVLSSGTIIASPATPPAECGYLSTGGFRRSLPLYMNPVIGFLSGSNTLQVPMTSCASPTLATGFVCYRGTDYGATNCGGTLFPWGGYTDGVTATGQYLPTTRAVSVNWWETHVFVTAWIGTAWLGNFTPEDGICRLWVVIGTSTTWSDQEFPIIGGGDHPTAEIYPSRPLGQQDYFATYRSVPLTDGVPCSDHGTSFTLSNFGGSNTINLPFGTIPPQFPVTSLPLWRHGAAIVMPSTIPVTVTW